MIEYVYFQNDVCFIADDENGDYDVGKAVKKIEMPDDVRIKA